MKIVGSREVESIERRPARVRRALVAGLSVVALAGACNAGDGDDRVLPSASPTPQATMDALVCGPLESYQVLSKSRVDGLHVLNMGNCVNVYDDTPVPRTLVSQVPGLGGSGGFIIKCLEAGREPRLWINFFNGPDAAQGYVDVAPSAIEQMDAYRNTRVPVPACPPLVDA